MLEPVAQQEGVVFVEIAIVKDQQEFAAVRIEALYRVRNTLREIPEISDAYVNDEILPLSVDRGDAGGAVKHVGPFRSLVPMQFTYASGVQAHVYAGEVLGNTEFSLRDLTGPATGFLPHMCVREGEAQIGQCAVVGRGWNEQIGVLPVTGDVTRTGIGAAVSGALRLRHRVTCFRASSFRRRKDTGGRRRQQCTSCDIVHNTHSFKYRYFAASPDLRAQDVVVMR